MTASKTAAARRIGQQLMKQAASPQQQIARYKTQAIARYGLRTRKGRPEELELPENPVLGVSISYGCRQVRVRLMDGRDWIASADFRIGKMDLARFTAILDAHFGFGADSTCEGGC